MKLPKKAKQVFKGIIFDVYQWEQEMFDGSKATFEMIKRPDTVQVLATQQNEILISDEEQPQFGHHLGFFGGRVDAGEDPLQAAKRELLEEAGLASDDWELLQIFEPHGKFEWQVYFYVARNCENVAQQKLDPGEKIQIKSLTWDEFLETISGDKFSSKDIVLDILKLARHPQKLKEFRNKLGV